MIVGDVSSRRVRGVPKRSAPMNGGPAVLRPGTSARASSPRHGKWVQGRTLPAAHSWVVGSAPGGVGGPVLRFTTRPTALPCARRSHSAIRWTSPSHFRAMRSPCSRTSWTTGSRRIAALRTNRQFLGPPLSRRQMSCLHDYAPLLGQPVAGNRRIQVYGWLHRAIVVVWCRVVHSERLPAVERARGGCRQRHRSP